MLGHKILFDHVMARSRPAPAKPQQAEPGGKMGSGTLEGSLRVSAA